MRKGFQISFQICSLLKKKFFGRFPNFEPFLSRMLLIYIENVQNVKMNITKRVLNAEFVYLFLFSRFGMRNFLPLMATMPLLQTQNNGAKDDDENKKKIAKAITLCCVLRCVWFSFWIYFFCIKPIYVTHNNMNRCEMQCASS